MFSRAVVGIGLICAACGGEASHPEAPVPHQEPAPAPAADSSEPIALVAPPPSASAENAEPPEPLASISGEPKPWDRAKCHGSNLDFEELRRTFECRVNERSKEPLPNALKMVQPNPNSVPQGSQIMVQVDLVNSGAEVVDFTVTVGESLPSVQLGKLQRGSKSLALSCMRYMITTRVTLRIELEPGGTLQFSTPLYANDSLSDRYRGEGEYAILSPSSGCDAKPLPRGNGYSVEARTNVNSGSLNGRITFSVN